MTFNVIAFLENLFREPDDLPADWHLAWDERAAIMESDGGLHRELAEAMALKIILDEMRQHGLS